MALAAAAAAAAGLAYLDAKLHIRKDLHTIRGANKVNKARNAALQQQRLSPFYLFEESSKIRPDHEAIWSRMGCYSWREVYDNTLRYAQFFLSQGVQPGELVAVMMQNSPDFTFTWLGLWAVGAAPAMINYNLTAKSLVGCIAISKARILLVDGLSEVHARVDEVRAELESNGITILDLGTAKPQIYQLGPIRPPDELRKDVKPAHPMALIYTSGTTGLPKACPLPVAAAHGLAMANETNGHPINSVDDRCYLCMPFYHGTGGISMISQMMCGYTACLAPKFSVSKFWDDVRDSRATWFVYVGETLRYLTAAPPSPRDRDHGIHSVFGNGCRPDVWARFRDRFGITTICEFYNSTEGTLSIRNPARGDFFAHAIGHHGFLLRRKYHDEIVPVAVDTDTGEILLDPKTGFATRVPFEAGGEILVRMPGERPFPGYFGNPEATEKKYVRDVFKKGDWFYRTGDSLRRDPDGRWYFMDRLGDTYRWKGENVSTAEVSEVLGSYPGVAEAIVYGVTLPGHDGKAGCAAVQIPNRSAFDFQDFLKHIRSKLPRYAVPVFIRVINESMATHNNKQNKVPLKQEGVDPDKVKQGDEVFWVEKHGKGSTYVPFTRDDWNSLGHGRARL